MQLKTLQGPRCTGHDNLSCGNPAARGHRAYGPVCSQSPGAGTVHSLQPCQLGNDSLLDMVLYPLLDMRGGAAVCEPLEIPGGFGVAPVIGVSGVATIDRKWAESQNIPLVIEHMHAHARCYGI